MSRFDGFVPGRHQLDAFGAGGFRFAGMSHRGSVLALPSGIRIWPVSRFSDVTPATFQPVLDEAESIDFLLIGTGANAGLISDIIACPGLDYCALANTRAIPVAQRIAGSRSRAWPRALRRGPTMCSSRKSGAWPQP